MDSMVHHHKYDYNIDMDSDHVGPRVCRMVGSEKRVLEIGAGPGAITRLLTEHAHCHVTAIELDEEAIDTLKPLCARVFRCDLNDADWPSVVSADGPFQVVVAADVLEHLYDPWSTLRATKQLLSEDGYLVVSLPHIGHQGVIASLASGRFKYGDWGLLDRTHVRFFGLENMQDLFEETGFKIVDADFLVRAPELTEFANDWASASEELKHCLKQCNFGRIYQVVIKAVPQSAADHGLKLTALTVPQPGPLIPLGASLGTKFRIVLKLLGRRMLSQRARARLSELLHRLGIRL